MKQFRPVIPDKLYKAISRYATAHQVSTTTAVTLLVLDSLKRGKYITKNELEQK